MNNLNSILIEGSVARDPRQRTTQSGKIVCLLTLASKRYFIAESGNAGKEVSFFDIEVWGRLAEACMKEGAKGKGIRVVGRLKQDRWNDGEGKPHARISIVAEHVEFSPKSAGKSGQGEEENESLEQEDAALVEQGEKEADMVLAAA